jgi:YCII-related domain
MPEFIIFMHSDSVTAETDTDWEAYIAMLHASGKFCGGSSIGNGHTYRDGLLTGPAFTQISGFIRVQAKDIAAARTLLEGNPTLQAGGTVEIRELVES